MSLSLSSKNHNKKASSSRDRDRNKSVASESGGSSQCDTPPLIEKDASTSQGRFAGIGADSILCMAEQVAAELNVEAATNLAEDVSYKLRQVISTIALHSEMLKKSRVDCWDVNSVLMLSDTSPVVGTCSVHYAHVGEEKICCQVETLMNVTECALTPQNYTYTTLPTVSVEWITDEKSLINNSNISASLRNYYTKVARAILNLKRKPKEIAVEDLMTNTRIGPIIPSLFNLAVLVLNDDNLNALNITTKRPMQDNILDMIDALCSNPCRLDTNVLQQFQRLFPVMVSSVLGNGSLAAKMAVILIKITRTWPSFITLGKGILIEYLAQGASERLSAPMIKCITALGRRALIECLDDHLEHLDQCIQAPRRNHMMDGIRESLLDASSCLLRSEPTTYLEDYVTADYALYEMLGDSILPRRTLFPYTDPVTNENTNHELSEEEVYITPLRPVIRRPKLRLIPTVPSLKKNVHREDVFEATRFSIHKCIKIKIKNCRSIDVKKHTIFESTQSSFASSRGVVAASGLLNRFRYKHKKYHAFPIFGALTL